MLFEAVVREGGFSAAARELRVSKASVSKQIAALEASLGVRLLHRTTRMVRVTEAGALFHDRCAEVVRLMNEAGDVLSAVQEDMVGLLRISIPTSFGRGFLDLPIAEFMTRFPRLSIEADVSDRPVDMLQGRYDLCIRIGVVNEGDLITRKLCKSRRLVVASPALLKKTGVIESPAALAHQPCLLYAHQFRRDKWIFADDHRAIEVAVSGRVRSSSGEFIATAACRGLGFAWLPDFIVAPYIANGQLVSLFDERCQLMSDVQAVWPSRKYMPTKVREFLKHLKAALSGRALGVIEE